MERGKGWEPVARPRVGDEISEGLEPGPPAHPRLTGNSANPTVHPKDSRKPWAEVGVMPPGGRCLFGNRPPHNSTRELSFPKPRALGNPHFPINGPKHSSHRTCRGPAGTHVPAPALSAPARGAEAGGPGRGAGKPSEPRASLPPAAVRASARQGPAQLHAPRPPGRPPEPRLPAREAGLRASRRPAASAPTRPHLGSRGCSGSWSRGGGGDRRGADAPGPERKRRPDSPGTGPQSEAARLPQHRPGRCAPRPPLL